MARKISNNIKINESYTGDDGAKLKNKKPIRLSKAVKAVVVAVLGLSITFASARVVSNIVNDSHFSQWDIQTPALDEDITPDDSIDLGDINDNQQDNTNDNVSDKTEDKTDDKVNDKTDDNTNDDTEGTNKDNQDINLTPGPTTPTQPTYRVSLESKLTVAPNGKLCRVAYIQASTADTADVMYIGSKYKDATLDDEFLIGLYLDSNAEDVLIKKSDVVLSVNTTMNAD